MALCFASRWVGKLVSELDLQYDTTQLTATKRAESAAVAAIGSIPHVSLPGAVAGAGKFRIRVSPKPPHGQGRCMRQLLSI